MKKILITGKNSFIGLNSDRWLKNYSDKYSIDSISVRDNLWKEMDFSGYDVILHTAGIAHIKESAENADLYFRINRDLSYQIAKKAKAEGVPQFILLSTMSVYGVQSGVIDKNTPLDPISNYGKSKLQAEMLVMSLEDKVFKVAILRPPMVYGKECRGNYARLTKLAKWTPFFPEIYNQRSMIYIYNLCEFIRLIIEEECRGIYFPQNEEYVCTSDLVKLIKEVHGKKVWASSLFNPLIRRLNLPTLYKLFGNLKYHKELSDFDLNYNVFSFVESIEKTELD